MTTFAINIGITIHKILGAKYLNVLHSGNLIGIVEAGINHGNGHALSAEACLVKFVGLAHLNLRDGRAIDRIFINLWVVD